ncbi:MAG: SDR family NAD(P)-dependent oxidoreductase, partial [Chloroflexota bacterium]|nr:SDR family NAD(P)-dependent oxidoreductase [Chloroflexota bacterium]
LALLVNNAGFTHATRFARLEPDAIEAMIRVHVVALVRLTRAALPGMLARGAGAVINVSSMLGFWPVPLGAGLTYAATKAFVTAFSRGLDREVARRGVRVQTLCPGWTRTELLERAGRPWDIPEAATMTPEAVVEASLAGLRLGEAVCLPSVHDPALLDHLDALAADLLAAAGSTGTTAPRYLG